MCPYLNLNSTRVKVRHTRQCVYCKTEFVACKINANYCSSKCYQAFYRTLHGEARNELMRRWRIEIRKKVLAHYGGVCVCCGEGTYEFLAIDHINGGGYKHRQETGVKSMHTYLFSKGLPPGYRVLCHNCNAALGYYGYCPHTKEQSNE